MFDQISLPIGSLVLRPFQENDVDAVWRGCSDAETQRWLPLPSPYTREMAQAWCAGEAEGFRASGDGIQLAIADAGTGQAVGGICLKRTQWRRGITEIGYWTGPDHRGRGYASAAAAALSRWALADPRLHRVELTVAVGNIASGRAATAAGFVYEGIARSAGYVHAGRIDLSMYSMIKADIRDSGGDLQLRDTGRP